MDECNAGSESTNLLIGEVKVHHYKDLPGKGLGRDFSGVLLDEKIIIQGSDYFSETWRFSKRNAEKRAAEMKAYITWEMRCDCGVWNRKVEMWFHL